MLDDLRQRLSRLPMTLLLVGVINLLPSIASSSPNATVVEVTDGDTIKVRIDSGVEHLRLIGIDAPEKSENARAKKIAKKFHKEMPTMLAEGKAAFEKLRSILHPGQAIELEFDIGRRDDYGRLLAYVKLANGEMVNERMVADGYAYPMTVQPNSRYASKFKKAFAEARQKHRGLWAK